MYGKIRQVWLWALAWTVAGVGSGDLLQAQQRRTCYYASIPDKQEKNTAQARVAATKLHTANTDEELLRIPVVVHVVYNQALQNISNEQIYSQLHVLNADYRRQNADTSQTAALFKPVAADCRIEFYLAQRDENGSATTGITRTQTTHGPFANNDIHQSANGGKDPWNPGKYLNIWVCAMAPGVLGYGTPPGTPAFRDGVVIHYQNFGTLGTATAPYNKGRSVTHEVGHWLNLKHLWGIEGKCNDDDGVGDTPRQESESNGCQLNRTSCGGVNMVQNFMDYSSDACMNVFTKGQKEVMRTTLTTLRKGLLTDQGYVLGNEKEEKESEQLSIYPNPSRNGLFVLNHFFKGTRMEVAIFNLLNIKVLDLVRMPSVEPFLLNLQDKPEGLYVVALKIDEKIITKKILYKK